MRRLGAVFLMCSALFAGHSAMAEGDTLSALKAWVGKYPADVIEGKTLWDSPALKTETSKFIGPKTQNYIFNEIGRQVASPVEIKDDVIYVFVCREHACVSNSARLFIDLKKNKVHICWRLSEDSGDLWLSADRDPQPVGPAGCSEMQPFDVFAKYGKD